MTFDFMVSLHSLRRVNVYNVDYYFVTRKPKSEINMVGNTCNQANWVDELFTRYEKCTVILQTAQLINISVLKESFKQTICRKQNI